MRYFILLLCALAGLTACGESDTDLETTKAVTPTVLVGQFSRVEALPFVLKNATGGLSNDFQASTGQDGRFTFVPGDTVNFYLNQVPMGSTQLTASGTVFLFDLGNDMDTAVGKAGLLIIGDKDRNLRNGIQLSAQFLERATWPRLDFTAPDLAVEFAQPIADAAIDGPNPIVPTRAQASDYLRDRQRCFLSGYYNIGSRIEGSTVIGDAMLTMVVAPQGQILAQVNLVGKDLGGPARREFPTDAQVPFQSSPSVHFKSTPLDDYDLTLAWPIGAALNATLILPGSAKPLTFPGGPVWVRASNETPQYRFVSPLTGGGSLGAFTVQIDVAGNMEVSYQWGFGDDRLVGKLDANGSTFNLKFEPKDLGATSQEFTGTVDLQALTITGTYKRGGSIVLQYGGSQPVLAGCNY